MLLAIHRSRNKVIVMDWVSITFLIWQLPVHHLGKALQNIELFVDPVLVTLMTFVHEVVCIVLVGFLWSCTHYTLRR